MVSVKRKPGSGKAVPYLSHEFVIQNHGDIVTCVFMVFIVGLMFQVTAPLASLFVVPQHNATEIVPQKATLYTYGLKDLSLTIFYTLSVIIFHAIIQEYVLDVNEFLNNNNNNNKIIKVKLNNFSLFFLLKEMDQESSPFKDQNK